MGAILDAWALQHPVLALLAGVGVGAILVAIIVFTSLTFFGKKRQLERHEYELRRGTRTFSEIRDVLRDHESSLENLNRLVETQQNEHRQLLARLFDAADTTNAPSEATKKPRRQRRSKKAPAPQDAWDIIAKDDEDAGPQG